MHIQTEILENKFPKKTQRSNRLEKKMHIGEHAEIIVDIELFHAHSVIRLLDDNGHCGDWYDDLYEAIRDAHGLFETMTTSLSTTSVMLTIPTKDFSLHDLNDIAKTFHMAIASVDPAAIDTHTIHITVGDAYYGQW